MESEHSEKYVVERQDHDPERYRQVYDDILAFRIAQDSSYDLSNEAEDLWYQKVEDLLENVARHKILIQEALGDERSFEEMLGYVLLLANSSNVPWQSRKLFCSLVGDNLDLLEVVLRSNEREFDQRLLSLETIQKFIRVSNAEVNRLYRNGDPSEHSEDVEDLLNFTDNGKDFIAKNLLYILEFIEEQINGRADNPYDLGIEIGDDLSFRTIMALTGLIENSSKAQATELAALFAKAFSLGIESADNALRDLFENSTRVFQESAQIVCEKIVEFYGLSHSEGFVEDWLKTAHHLRGAEAQLELSRIFRSNLFSIRTLEQNHAGSVRRLTEEFGIRDFGRYPEEILLAQYAAIDELDKPYGIVLYPIEDFNGAFYKHRQIFRELYNELKNKYGLLVVEAKSKMDLGRRLIELNKKYGSNHKISFAIIGGHGEANSIQFGEGTNRAYLKSEDLTGKGVRKSKKFFEEDASIILVSCSTGQPKGIAEKLSAEFGLEVIAPDAPTNLGAIHVSETQSGKLKFDVRYYKQGSAKTYSRGHVQRQYWENN